MDHETRRAIEHDCARAITTFFTLLDGANFEEQWRQVASGGCWDRGGKQLDTREKFLAAMAERPKVLTIRHMITNLLVEVSSDGTAATGTFNLLVFAYLADRGDKPAPMALPSAIAAFRARFVPEAGVWRIAHLSGDQLFKG